MIDAEHFFRGPSAPDAAPAPTPVVDPIVEKFYGRATAPGETTDPDAPLRTLYCALAGRLGASAEAATPLVEHDDGLLAAIEARSRKQHADQVARWRSEVMADPELGGAYLNEHMAAANRALQRFAPPELGKALVRTGFGNHPGLVRFFVRLGAAMEKPRVPGADIAGTFFDHPTSRVPT